MIDDLIVGIIACVINSPRAFCMVNLSVLMTPPTRILRWIVFQPTLSSLPRIVKLDTELAVCVCVCVCVYVCVAH